jgi:hypothetical protein
VDCVFIVNTSTPSPSNKRTLQNPAYKTSQREKPIKWTVESSLSAMLTSMSYKGSPLPPCKWCARRSASLSHSPSWRSSRSHSSHVETPRHHSASRSRTHPTSQHSLRPLQGTAPRPRAPRCASRAAPASSTLPTTLSSCDGRLPLRKPGRAGLFDTTYESRKSWIVILAYDAYKQV